MLFRCVQKKSEKPETTTTTNHLSKRNILICNFLNIPKPFLFLRRLQVLDRTVRSIQNRQRRSLFTKVSYGCSLLRWDTGTTQFCFCSGEALVRTCVRFLLQTNLVFVPGYRGLGPINLTDNEQITTVKIELRSEGRRIYS